MAKASDNPRTSKPKAAKSNKFLDLANSAKEVIITITALVSLIILIFGSGKIGTISTEQESIDFMKWTIIILSVSLATFIAYSIAKIYQSPGKLVNKIINQDNIYAIIASVSAGLLTAVYVSYNSGDNWSVILKNALSAGILVGVILGIVFANFMKYLYKVGLIGFYNWVVSIGKLAKFTFFFIVSTVIAISIPSLIQINTVLGKLFKALFDFFKNNLNTSKKPWESYGSIWEFWIIVAIIFVLCFIALYVLIRLIHAAHKELELKAKAEAEAEANKGKRSVKNKK